MQFRTSEAATTRSRGCIISVFIEAATPCAKALFVVAIGLASCSAAGFGCGAQDISTRFSSLIYGASSVFAVVAGASSLLKVATWQRSAIARQPGLFARVRQVLGLRTQEESPSRSDLHEVLWRHVST